MNWLKILIIILLVLNTSFALGTVFYKRRDIAATWAWLMVLVFFPGVGFIAYMFVGRGLSNDKLFQLKRKTKLELDKIIKKQSEELDSILTSSDRIVKEADIMIKFFGNTDHAFLTRRNMVSIITDGHALFNDLFNEIERAKHHIHVEFYTFYNDGIGQKLIHLLEKKCSEGIEVKILWDSWGSLGTDKKIFQKLRQLGGEAANFLETRSFLDNFRLNFRGHRKIVVIDGKIGYTGGFNVGDQYLGLKSKFGYWRDTHLKIIGSGVHGLQSRFILDWNANGNISSIDEDFNAGSKYFPVAKAEGQTNLQIVSSGPDSEIQKIKLGYLSMINAARESIWIQSPYFIPDDSVLDALRIAVSAGVDVRIMLPNKPDHPLVYRATQYYAWQCAKWGIKIYYYNNGFIHAKTIIIDNKISSVGSANMDFRSFKLNFELNSFMYGSKISNKLRNIYKSDINNSELQTEDMFEEQSKCLKIKQLVSRLFSPIL